MQSLGIKATYDVTFIAANGDGAENCFTLPLGIGLEAKLKERKFEASAWYFEVGAQRCFGRELSECVQSTRTPRRGSCPKLPAQKGRTGRRVHERTSQRSQQHGTVVARVALTLYALSCYRAMLSLVTAHARTQRHPVRDV